MLGRQEIFFFFLSNLKEQIRVVKGHKHNQKELS